MTGDVVSGKVDGTPEYAQIVFRFPDTATSFTSVRKLGEISLVGDPGEYIAQRNFGPDALKVEFGTFYREVENRTAMIKSIFINQHLLAGVGNIYSDETCFRLGLDPRTKVGQFNRQGWTEIFRTMQEVLREGIQGEIDDNWLIYHREPGDDCPRCSGKVERIEVGGRGTYLCPSCQDRSLGETD